LARAAGYWSLAADKFIVLLFGLGDQGPVIRKRAKETGTTGENNGD
jgi:hypothetical protein